VAKAFDVGAWNRHGGLSHARLLEEYERIAAGSSNRRSFNFMGFLDSGNSNPALSAAAPIPVLNHNLVDQDICVLAATSIETEVVHWLRQNMGFEVQESYASSKDKGGALTLRGCLSNIIALIAV
jgi:glutamate/tyrosine decarboxylase-like PLP-dependent enzyme